LSTLDRVGGEWIHPAGAWSIPAPPELLSTLD